MSPVKSSPKLHPSQTKAQFNRFPNTNPKINNRVQDFLSCEGPFSAESRWGGREILKGSLNLPKAGGQKCSVVLVAKYAKYATARMDKACKTTFCQRRAGRSVIDDDWQLWDFFVEFALPRNAMLFSHCLAWLWLKKKVFTCPFGTEILNGKFQNIFRVSVDPLLY